MAPNASSTLATSSNSVLISITQQLPHLAIVDRLVDQFPLVNTALDFAGARYSALKSSSQLVGATLGRAEKSFEYVVSTAVVPVLNQLEQPIHYADNKAVQGLDLVQAKLGSIQKSGGELKDTTLKVLDQTKERIQAVKTQTLSTVQSKVHSVLTMPSNVVPLVDQILAAGENVLDYLLPDATGSKDGGAQNGAAPNAGEEDGDPKDTKALLRIIFVRMRAFTDKVQRRVVDYSRDRWIPALFSRVVVIKGNLAQLVANGAAAGNKFLANGHGSSSSSVPAGAEEAQAGGAPNQASSSPKSNKTKSSPSSSPSSHQTKATSTTSGSPNGDVNKTQEQSQPQQS